MFLVTGITGKVGGAAARHLLAEGHTIRAYVRDPAKAAPWADKQVELRKGDFNDANRLADALTGVEGAYLMLPPVMAPEPGFPEARTIIRAFRSALDRSPPPRLVVLSSIGSDQPRDLGLITSTHLLEEGLRDLPFPTVFIRPGSFLENYLPNLQAAAASGRFDTFMTPRRATPMTATEDIGAEIARRLAGPAWAGRKVVELGNRYSPDDLAHAMTEVLGRPVMAHAIPRDRWAATMQGFGMPPAAIEPFSVMEDGVNSGWIDFDVPGTEPVPGTTTPAQVFARHLDHR